MRHILITGGARGIGAAAVRRFAALGDRVTFFYARSHDAARQLSLETGAAAVCCDVSDGEAVRQAFSRLADVDVLICCAGIAHYGLLSQTDEATFDRLYAVNVKGVYHCVNAATPFFLKKQRGCVITVSSMWGQVGASCEAAYSATKGAVIALTKALAQELGPSGVRVNCVSPGLILTDMCANLDGDTLSQMAEDTPLCRNGTPNDVAYTMEYLADAPFVTGQVIGVNGGYIM